MSNEALGQARQAIVIALGQGGNQVLSSLERRLIERHGGVPTIQLLALNAGPGPDDPYQGRGQIEFLNLEVELDQLLDKRKTDIGRWLPGEVATLAQNPDDLAQTRQSGSLALFGHADIVHAMVHRAANLVLSVATRTDLASRGLRVQDESSLDVYILADLGEPLASGAFIDLAYLAAYAVTSEVSDRVFPQISGVLFMPSFREAVDVSALSREALIRQGNLEMTRQADAYAALKELDHYMDRRHYEVAYSQRLTFRLDSMPFTRSCYLVDAVNERNKGMPSQDQMTEMVGEWLYHMLASPLKADFQEPGVRYSDARSHGKVAAYSSLGLAAYFCPVEHVIEANAHRLAYELLDRCLLRSAPEQAELPAAELGAQPQEVQEALQNDLAWDAKKDSYFYVNPQHFAHIGAHDLDRLEGQIRRTFGARLTQMLPLLRRGMNANLELMTETLEDRLNVRVASIVNSALVGGTSLARRFLHKLKADLQNAEGRAREEGERYRRDMRALGQQTRQDRANHVAATKTFGSAWALAALGGSLLALGVWLYYLLLTVLDKLDLLPGANLGNLPTIAAVVLLLGFLFGLGGAAWLAWEWWRRTRDGYLEDHRRRLRLALDIDLKGVEAQYCTHAQEIVDDQLAEVLYFEERLDDLRAEFDGSRQAPRPLYGSPRFVLEESVIDESDLDRFYRAQVSEGLEPEVLALFQEYGPYYGWKDQSDEEIAGHLLAFGRARFEPLRRQTRAEDLLVRHATEHKIPDDIRFSEQVEEAETGAPGLKRAVRYRMDNLADNSMPFLRYNELELETGISSSLIHRIGFEGAQNENSLIYQVLADQETPVTLTEDRHTIVSMTVRHGLPLASIGLLRRWSNDYETLRSRVDRPLHTRRSHLALPDLFPVGEDVLEPHMAVSLGVAYRKLTQRSDEPYTFRYQDDLGETVRAELGADKLAACVSLQNAPVILRILSKQIEEETIERSNSVDKEGQRRGNRYVIDFFRRYKRRNKDELEDWEEAMIDEYVARLER